MPDEDTHGSTTNQHAASDADSEEAFRTLVRPHMDTLLQLAEHDLAYYADRDVIHGHDLAPEDLVGETLAYAWQHREQQPDAMSLRDWLLGMQHRVTRRLVDEIATYRDQKALSLDDEIPPDARGRGFQERRQYGAQPEVNITWEDVTPGREPRDIEAPLFTNRDTFGLDPDSRHVVMMHDEFDMPLPDVAATMNRTVKETASLLEQARTTIHQELDASDSSETQPPPA